MFRVDIRYLSEHAEALHRARRQLLAAGNDAAAALQTLERLSHTAYPVERLNGLRAELNTAADRLRALENAAQAAAAEYAGAEQKVEGSLEDTQARLRALAAEAGRREKIIE